MDIDTLLILGILLLLFLSEIIINMTYKKYSEIDTNVDKTGYQVVTEMLSVNGISDVTIGGVAGTLSDYYNSNKKEIRLSKNSYERHTITSVAVAAHETGHAVQDHTHYPMLVLRKLLTPICSIASKFVWIFIFVGLLFQFFDLIVIGLILMGVTVLFQLITLPVEFDASRRAIKYLENVGYDSTTMIGIKKVLRAAAFTYVAGTLASLMQLIRLILGLNRKD